MVAAIDSFLMEVVVEAVTVVVVMVAAAVVLLVAFVVVGLHVVMQYCVGFEQNSDGHGSCQCSHPKPCNPNPSSLLSYHHRIL